MDLGSLIKMHANALYMYPNVKFKFHTVFCTGFRNNNPFWQKNAFACVFFLRSGEKIISN